MLCTLPAVSRDTGPGMCMTWVVSSCGAADRTAGRSVAKPGLSFRTSVVSTSGARIGVC